MEWYFLNYRLEEKCTLVSQTPSEPRDPKFDLAFSKSFLLKKIIILENNL
jgi:hypothetical protein